MIYRQRKHLIFKYRAAAQELNLLLIKVDQRNLRIMYYGQSTEKNVVVPASGMLIRAH